MPVAEMPGDAGEMQRVSAADFKERLGRCDDLDKSAVLEHERIAAAQFRRRRQVEQKRGALGAGHRYAAAMAIVVIEDNAIGRRVRPCPSRSNSDRAHGRQNRK